MLKQFYRLMVVALGFFVASSCGEATPKYGNIYTDYDEGAVDAEVSADLDEGTVDADVVESETITPDEDFVESETVMSDDDSVDKEQGDPAYGCPAIEYLVEGKVASVLGEPIRGIEINTVSLQCYRAYSDERGDFSWNCRDECYGSMPQTIKLVAMDVDGEQNGSFAKKEKIVPLECDSPISWENHCTNTEVKIELEEVSSDDDALLKD